MELLSSLLSSVIIIVIVVVVRAIGCISVQSVNLLLRNLPQHNASPLLQLVNVVMTGTRESSAERLAPTPSLQLSRKRKRATKPEINLPADASTKALAPSSGKSKRRKLKNPQDIEDRDLDGLLCINHAIGRMDRRLLVDHLAQRTSRFEPDLSMVELQDLTLPSEQACCGRVFFELTACQKLLSETQPAGEGNVAWHSCPIF